MEGYWGHVVCFGADFWVHFGRLGAALGLILETLGCHWGFFGVIGVLGGPSWGSGGTPGSLRRAIALKDRWCLLASPHFKRFWRPKGAQKASKMELKSVKNPSKIQSTKNVGLLTGFEMVFGGLLEGFGDPGAAILGAKMLPKWLNYRQRDPN